MRLSRSKLRRLIKEAISDISGNINPGDRVALVNEPYDASKLSGVTQPTSQMAFKPNGYWFACGPEWIEFTRREMKSKYYENGYLYEFEFNYTDINNPDPNHMLSIRNNNHYEIFKEKYLRPDTFPDWPKIAQDFGGIELCPLPSDYNFWLRTWDVPSGCFWNSDVVKTMRTLHEPEAASEAVTSIVNAKHAKTYDSLPDVIKDVFEEVGDEYMDYNPFEAGNSDEIDFIFNENHDPDNPEDYTIFDAIQQIFENYGYRYDLSGDFYEIANNITDYLSVEVEYYWSYDKKIDPKEVRRMKREKDTRINYANQQRVYKPRAFDYLRPNEKMQLLLFVINRAEDAPTFGGAGLTLAVALSGNEQKMEDGYEILDGVNQLLSDTMIRLGFNSTEAKVDLDRDSAFEYQMRENESPTRFDY